MNTTMTFQEWLTEKPYMSAALRDELGVTRSAIWQAKQGLMPIPFSWNATIERLSHGQLKASALDELRIAQKRGEKHGR
jgi:hypothetical protein